MVLTTCTSQGRDDTDPGSSSSDADDGTAGADAAPACPDAASFDALEVRSATDTGALPATAAVTTGLTCAEEVVVVPADAAATAAIAAPLAVGLDAPLLLGTVDELDAALTDLGDPEVREVAPPGAESSLADLALEVADELGRDRFVAAPADAPALLTAAAGVAIRTDAAVLPVDADLTTVDLPDGAEVAVLGDVDGAFDDASTVEHPWPTTGDGEVAWLVTPDDAAAVPTVVLAALRGEDVVPVSDGDLLGRRTVQRVRGAELPDDRLVPVGSFGGDPAVEVTQLAEAPLLPGGTLRLFDGTRMVALYGTPGSTALGALGEQDLDATVARVREVGQGYDADGRQVVPTFEIIVTVASNSAGDSYSNVAPPERFEEWVDRAEEEDIQVILDLQPGRQDFLTQARVYEDLLRRPHVGLALDPEWRLEDDQEHLEVIGGVDADEVQEVVDWLAELTREEGQTHKLLVLHQFRLSMLRDRDTIEVPPEIAAVVHADGQGPQAMKMETWRTMTEGAEDRWLWGWKNFYDEDPVVATPDEVLDLDPEVVLVTYQ